MNRLYFPRWLWLALIGLLVTGLLLPVSPRYRPVPSDDPSVYLYTGATILRGGAPYHDAWDHKQPLAFLVYALALLISPHSLWGIWIIELVALAAAGVLGFLLLEQVAPRPVSFLAVALGLLTLFVILWGYALEELALPLLLFTLYAFIRLQNEGTRGNAAWGLAAGVATGAAFFLKQSLVAAGLVVGLYLLIELLLRRDRRRAWALLGMALGAGLVAGPLLIYLWQSGALADYRDAVFGFNLAYAGLGPLERVRAILDALEILGGTPGLFLCFALWVICLLLALLEAGPALAGLLRLRALRPICFAAGAALIVLSLAAELVGSEPGFGLLQWLAILAGAVLMLAGLLARPSPLRERLAHALQGTPILPAHGQPSDNLRTLLWQAVLFFPALLVLATLSGRNYVYYFIPLVAFLILSLGLLAGVAGCLVTNGPARRAGAALLLGLGIALAYNPLLQITGAYQTPAHPALPAIVDYVTAHTGPEDTIMAWGKETTYIYFMTNRRAQTRYFYQAAISLDAYNAAHHVAEETLRDLQSSPPRLFIFNPGSPDQPTAGKCPLPASTETNTPGAVYQFICDHYHYTGMVGEFWIFQRQ